MGDNIRYTDTYEYIKVEGSKGIVGIHQIVGIGRVVPGIVRPFVLCLVDPVVLAECHDMTALMGQIIAFEFFFNGREVFQVDHRLG